MKAYDQITDRIIETIKSEGAVPWRKPWRTESPRNIRGNAYRGINRLVLAIQPYSDPRWMTFRQIRDQGGHVRKGEKGAPIILWRELEVDSTPGKVLLARSYSVFNAEQTVGLELSAMSHSETATVTSSVENLARNLSPAVGMRRGNAALYSPTEDVIEMPYPELFETHGAYEQTMAHELIHATGHVARLNRKEVNDPIRFGSSQYAKEELVAELGAAFLTAELGIACDLGQSAAYVGGWLKALQNDKSLIIQAASAAQKATDYLLARPARESVV